MIKYLGSKRVLVPALVQMIQKLDGVRSVLDVFSGTSRVGHALKAAGHHVAANDHNAYAHVLAQCYVATDKDRFEDRARRVLEELQRVPGNPGYVTQTFCKQSRFFQPKNGERIDAIRDRIDALELDPFLRAVALVSLMEAADRVDSTTGLQMAFLKQWAPRAHNDLQLRLPKILAGPGEACQLDALQFVQTHQADLAYLDPPYNQHSYLRNYHIWETLVRWDAPEFYGMACKRVDCKDRGSRFNRKREILAAFTQLVDQTDAKHIMVSFSDEGFIARTQLEDLLRVHGHLHVHAIEHDRYVGARIGIYSPKGKKVGRVGRLKNVEYLFHLQRD